MPFLTVENVSKGFGPAGKRSEVLHGIDLTVERGEFVALTRATLQTEIERICQQARKTVVLITNDVDEGILLADRIIPLSAGPGATLGPEVRIDIPRPRDRKAINHDPRFKAIRHDVI